MAQLEGLANPHVESDDHVSSMDKKRLHLSLQLLAEEGKVCV